MFLADYLELAWQQFFLNQGKDLSERDNFFENEDFVNKRLW